MYLYGKEFELMAMEMGLNPSDVNSSSEETTDEKKSEEDLEN